MPSGYTINHNQLSSYAKIFFPYVSLILEPKKRESTSESTKAGKYGTYLRYKRIHDYENADKIHERMIYFYINYEMNEEQFIDVIGKQFNLSRKQAINEIEKITSDKKK